MSKNRCFCNLLGSINKMEKEFCCMLKKKKCHRKNCASDYRENGCTYYENNHAGCADTCSCRNESADCNCNYHEVNDECKCAKMEECCIRPHDKCDEVTKCCERENDRCR